MEVISIDVAGKSLELGAQPSYGAFNDLCQGEDRTGLRLWALPARRVVRFLEDAPSLVRGKRVVELGSGVGLVARVCCDEGAELVLATDGEDRLLDVIRANAPEAAVRRLDWAAPDLSDTFDVVLGADLIYSTGALASGLFETCTKLCRPGGTLLLCIPAGRHGSQDILNELMRDARWGLVTCYHTSWSDIADGHRFVLVEAGRSKNVPHPVRADALALRQSGQLPASTGRCGELPDAPSSRGGPTREGPPMRRTEYIPHGSHPA